MVKTFFVSTFKVIPFLFIFFLQYLPYFDVVLRCEMIPDMSSCFEVEEYKKKKVIRIRLMIKIRHTISFVNHPKSGQKNMRVIIQRINKWLFFS